MKGHYIRHGYNIPLKERFMLHVEIQPNGCWNWTASTRDGYGQMKVDGHMCRCHRLSWEMFRGPIPEDKCVLHKCIGNRLCVNPDHLYLGTKKNNAEDRKNQGRGGNLKGEANGRAKATEEIVKYIRSVRSARPSMSDPSFEELAIKFGISVGIVKGIVYGNTWKHVPP